MEIRTLQWDSDFFGLRIGRVDLQTAEDTIELKKQQENLSSNLTCYISLILTI